MQLAIAGAMLIAIFSGILYHYIEISIFENVAISLNRIAKDLEPRSKLYALQSKIPDVKISVDETKIQKPYFSYNKDKSSTQLHYPTSYGTLIIDKNTKEYSQITAQILSNIIFINATAIFLILFYALFLSRILVLPVRALALKLSKLNEHSLKGVESTQVPSEFEPLAKSINRLIERIEAYALSQKELFIGAAHELKTPLAVMKTKNEVTLLKDRPKEQYCQALEQNIKSIDQMNKMVSAILQIGRGEAAQFEKPVNTDIIAFLGEICESFKALAKKEGKSLSASFSPKSLKISIQTTLFTHIMQNFLQNALKFSPEGSEVKVETKLLDNILEISVSDEGCGIGENKDIFAPFKRYGKAGGSGLGLFVAKNAANAMGAQISVLNRDDDKSGAVARLLLKIS